MTIRTKTIKGRDYLYECSWNPLTKKDETTYLGKAEDTLPLESPALDETPTIPKLQYMEKYLKKRPIKDEPATASYPTKAEQMRTEMFSLLEADQIDQALVILVTEINEDFLNNIRRCELFPNPAIMKMAINNLNKIICDKGIPLFYTELFQRLLVKWRKESPVYDQISLFNESEIEESKNGEKGLQVII